MAFSTRLKDTLESALSGGRQQASEVSQLQEDLRVALDAIQVTFNKLIYTECA